MEKLKTSYMAYIQNYLLVVLILIFLWLIYLRFGLTLSLRLYEAVKLAGVFSLAFVAIYLIDEPFYRRLAYCYILTDSEITEVRGIITKRKLSIPYINVSDVTLNKGVIGRVFNFGNIKVSGIKNNITLVGMRNPETIYTNLKERIASFSRRGQRKVKS